MPIGCSGIMMITFGMILIVLGARELAFMGGRVANTAVAPEHLVISGVYNFSRNPMYVGMVVAVLGCAVSFNTL